MKIYHNDAVFFKITEFIDSYSEEDNSNDQTLDLGSEPDSEDSDNEPTCSMRRNERKNYTRNRNNKKPRIEQKRHIPNYRHPLFLQELVDTRMSTKKNILLERGAFPSKSSYKPFDQNIKNIFVPIKYKDRINYSFEVSSGSFKYFVSNRNDTIFSVNPLKSLVFVFDQTSLTQAQTLSEELAKITAEAPAWKMFAARKYEAMKQKCIKTIQSEHPHVIAEYISRICRDHTRGLRKTIHLGAWAKSHKNNNGTMQTFITYDTRSFRSSNVNTKKYIEPAVGTTDWRSGPSPAAWKLLECISPIMNAVSAIIRHTFPLYSELQEKLLNFNEAHENTKNYIPGGLFSSIAINFDCRTKTHIDMSDMLLGWCFVLSFGDFTDGDLTFYQLGFRIPLQNGSLVGFRSSLLFHGNIPFSGYRNSIVMFTCSRSVQAMYNSVSREDQERIDFLINNM